MRFSYSVRNLRRLTSTPQIEIRPITVLLGRNSVGKSTFLRSLALLRQSIDTKSSAPILWFGDYVDFGDYKSAVSEKDTSKKICFSFEIVNYKGRYRNTNALAARFDAIRGRAINFDVDDLKVSYQVGSETEKTVRHHISIETPSVGSRLDLSFDGAGTLVSSAKINNHDLKDLLASFEIYLVNDSIFADPFFLSKRKEGKTTRLVGTPRILAFSALVEQRLSTLVDGRTSKKRILSEARRILGHRSLDEQALFQLSKAETATFQRIYQSFQQGKKAKDLEYLDFLCRSRFLFDLLEIVGDDLKAFFRSVEYIGPARARSERFYRQQELEVSEISPDGRNLPMFLASLDTYQMQDFSDWVKKVFGYGVSVHKSGGHVSINLDHRGQSVNVADTGYGVSQVLPVLAQIWWMQSDRSGRQHHASGNFDIKTLTIEQPELHLHPAHQAMLADVFVDAQIMTRKRKEPTQFYVVETHSEALINRLGELIEKGSIDARDVQVVIFGDLSDSLEQSDVTIARFNDLGVLENWPHGFFSFG